MNAKILFSTLLVVLCFTSLFSLTTVSAQEQPVISIEPSVIEVNAPGESFEVELTITNVEDLWQFIASVQWNHTILNITSVSEGSFMSDEGSTVFTAIAPPFVAHSNEAYPGEIHEITCGFMSDMGVTGSGVLATLTFTSIAEGETELTLGETTLYTSMQNSTIEHEVAFSDVTVIPEFQTWMIAPIFLVASIIAVTAKKRFQ